MLTITQGMTRTSLNSLDQITFDDYDKDGDGTISYAEYNNFVAVSGINKAETQRAQKTQDADKGFNVEQFDPQGSINFESNGGFNAQRLNVLA